MVVQCPQCKTKYKVSDDVVADAAPSFRCSRCKHTFELEMPELSEPFNHEDRSSKTRMDEDRELSFTFPAQEKKELFPQKEKEITDSTVRNNELAKDESDLSDRWSINTNAAKDEKAFTMAGSEQPALKEPTAVAGDAGENEPSKLDVTFPQGRETAPNVYAITPNRDQRASTVPFLMLFVLLIIFYGFATAYHQVHPLASEDIVGKV